MNSLQHYYNCISIIFILGYFDLILYVAKVFTFRKYKTENIQVYRRIMHILTQIVILTVMYQIPFLIEGIFEGYGSVINFSSYSDDLVLGERIVLWVWYSLGGAVSIAWCLSMFLMQQHNTQYYKKFLNDLYRARLHYVFCFCCNTWIKEEIDSYVKLIFFYR